MLRRPRIFAFALAAAFVVAATVIGLLDAYRDVKHPEDTEDFKVAERRKRMGREWST